MPLHKHHFLIPTPQAEHTGVSHILQARVRHFAGTPATEGLMLAPGSRLDFLREKHTDVAATKAKIIGALDGRGTKYDPKILTQAFEIIDWFYGEELRDDKTTPASTHAYAVMYNCAMLGCDFDHVLAAGFHDMYEDGHKIHKLPDEVKNRISDALVPSRADRLHDMMLKLSNQHKRLALYPKFLRQIYESKDIQLMVIKAMDTVENIKTMDFAGAKPGFKNRICRKALMHMDIWKKLSRELFGVMIDLLRRPHEGLSETNRRRIELQSSGKSLKQAEYEEKGIAILTKRGEFSLEFLRNLPYSGSKVLSVFAPGTLQDDGHVEIEVPQEAASREAFKALLKAHFPEMQWRAVKSALPSGLACTWIFRSRDRLPSDFLKKVRTLSEEVFKNGEYD